MLTVRPLTARFMRGVDPSGFRRRVRTVEVDPAGRVQRAPPLFEAGELDRIIAHHDGTNAQDDLERLLHTSRIEPATSAVIVPDVIVDDATLLRLGGLEVLRPGKKRPVIFGLHREIKEAMLCTDSTIERYFGHWIADGWSREQLALDRGFTPSVLEPERFSQSKGYRELIDLTATSISGARVEELWLIDDRGYNPSRMARYNRVRARLRAALSTADGPKLVFLRRGSKAAGRTLLNEEEVMAALQARGFTIIDPEALEVRELASAMRQSRIVVGVEGSALAHANAVLDSGAFVVAIQAPTAFNSIHRIMTADTGQRFAFCVGEQKIGDDFTMPVDRLLRLLALVENEIR